MTDDFPKFQNQLHEGGHEEHEEHGEHDEHGEHKEEALDHNNFESWWAKVTNKEFTHFEENFNSMTVLCYTIKAQKDFVIGPETQSHNLFNCLMIFAVQLTMLTCMLYSLVFNQDGESSLHFAKDFSVLLVKLPCAIALHLCLYPEVMEGMVIMKYANNQPCAFVKAGSEISFMIGLLQFLIACYCEGINVYMLSNQHSVEHCIIHFVALEVIMELPKMYFEALSDNYLRKVCHIHARNKWKCADLKFSQRTIFHKIARVLYKLLRGIYVSVIFYFIPFVVLFLNFVWA